VADPAVSTCREAADAVGLGVQTFKWRLHKIGLFESALARFKARSDLRAYHGTPRRYRGSQTRPACHCTQCRRANTDYCRRMREARRARNEP
jgi:hypothetical protein